MNKKYIPFMVVGAVLLAILLLSGSSNLFQKGVIEDTSNGNCCGYWITNGGCAPAPECVVCPTNPLTFSQCQEQLNNQIIGGSCKSIGGNEYFGKCIRPSEFLLYGAVLIIGIGLIVFLRRHKK